MYIYTYNVYIYIYGPMSPSHPPHQWGWVFSVGSCGSPTVACGGGVWWWGVCIHDRFVIYLCIYIYMICLTYIWYDICDLYVNIHMIYIYIYKYKYIYIQIYIYMYKYKYIWYMLYIYIYMYMKCVIYMIYMINVIYVIYVICIYIYEIWKKKIHIYICIYI